MKTYVTQVVSMKTYDLDSILRKSNGRHSKKLKPMKFLAQIEKLQSFMRS